jgi:outer membrane lipoprotein SlyB
MKKIMAFAIVLSMILPSGSFKGAIFQPIFEGAGAAFGAAFGALTGGRIGAGIGENIQVKKEIFQINGKSDLEIKEILTKLRKKARFPENR